VARERGRELEMERGRELEREMERALEMGWGMVTAVDQRGLVDQGRFLWVRL
jgi:hypothetical protein